MPKTLDLLSATIGLTWSLFWLALMWKFGIFDDGSTSGEDDDEEHLP